MSEQIKTEISPGDYVANEDIPDVETLEAIKYDAVTLVSPRTSVQGGLGEWNHRQRRDGFDLVICQRSDRMVVWSAVHSGRRWAPNELQAAAVIRRDGLNPDGWYLNDGAVHPEAGKVMFRDGTVYDNDIFWGWSDCKGDATIIAYHVAEGGEQ